jgi:hypothetical protein
MPAFEDVLIEREILQVSELEKYFENALNQFNSIHYLNSFQFEIHELVQLAKHL